MHKRFVYIIIAFFVCSVVNAQRPNWVVNESLFQQNSTIICTLNLNGVYLTSPNDMVAAFVGNECRGVSKPTFVPSINKYLCFLVVFSNMQGEEIVFRVYDSKKDQVVNVGTKINFNINAQLGTFFQPFSIAFPKLNSEADLISFDLFNYKYDSLRISTDLITGLRTLTYHIRFRQQKDTVYTDFRLSPGAKLYLGQKEILTKTTAINFSNTVQLQIKSEDESLLNPFNVKLVNATSFPICEDTLNNPQPKITSTSNFLCTGDSILLTSSNAASYLWSNGAVGSSVKVGITGSYTVTATYANGCKSTSSPTILTFNPKPNLPRINDVSVCLNATIPALTAVADSGHSIRWYGINASGGSFTSTAPVVSSSSVGVTKYYVCQINTFGCESDRSVINVTINDLPSRPTISSEGLTTFCLGDSVKLISSQGFAYNWNTGSKTSSIFVKLNGVYRLTVINEKGCMSDSSAEFKVTVNAPPPIPILNSSKGNTLCVGDSAILSASSISGTFIWIKDDIIVSGAISKFLTIKSSGSYRVINSNEMGCSSSSATLLIAVSPIPSKPDINWDGSVFSTQATSVNYQWLQNGVDISGAQNSTLKPTNTGVFRLKVINSFGCTNLSDSIRLLVTAINNFVLTPNSNIAKLYPIPATQFINVEFSNMPLVSLHFQLINAAGKVVQLGTGKSRVNLLNISDLQSGVYYLKVIGKDYNQVQKVLIKK
jgi:hypothetical protein